MSKRHKKYSIDSFEKLVNVANAENIDRLSVDLISWLAITIAAIDRVRKEFPEETKGKLNWEIMNSAFNWIDDGKNDIIGVTMHDSKTGEEHNFKPE